MKFSASLANTALTTLAVFVALAAAITEDEFTEEWFTEKTEIYFKSNEYDLDYKERCDGRLRSRTTDDKNVLEAFCNKNAEHLYDLFECPICLSPLNAGSLATTRCGHLMHRKCFLNTLKSSGKCPSCRRPLRDKSNANDATAGINRDTVLKSILAMFERMGLIPPMTDEEIMVDYLDTHFILIRETIRDIGDALVESKENSVVERAIKNYLDGNAVLKGIWGPIRNRESVNPSQIDWVKENNAEELQPLLLYYGASPSSVGHIGSRPVIAERASEARFRTLTTLHKIPNMGNEILPKDYSKIDELPFAVRLHTGVRVPDPFRSDEQFHNNLAAWVYTIALRMSDGLKVKLQRNQEDNLSWSAQRAQSLDDLQRVKNIITMLENAFVEVVSAIGQKYRAHCDSLLIALATTEEPL